jgi:TorA maturation chaperone TorD
MSTKEFISRESFKMEAYRLLADCYYLPSQELAATLERLEHSLKIVCPEAAKHVLSMIEEVSHKENSKRLEIEYARLFVGPYGLLAPPYGSVYLENGRRVMGDSTLHALVMYREAGVNISTDFSDAPDHIVAELEFIYYLFFKEIESIAEGTYADAINYLSMRRAFLKMHLGAWVSQFALNVEKNAETGFYKDLARLTKRFVRQELELSLHGIRKFLNDRTVEVPGSSVVGDGPHLL